MIPTVTSMVPSMFFGVIGKLKKESGEGPPSRGKMNSSLNSHNRAPITRNPPSLMSKSLFLYFPCPNFLFSFSWNPVELAMLLAKSDRRKPNTKCSRVSSSEIIGCIPQGNW